MKNGSYNACFLRKCGVAGTAKDPISKESGCERCEQTRVAYAAFYEKTASNV